LEKARSYALDREQFGVPIACVEPFAADLTAQLVPAHPEEAG